MGYFERIKQNAPLDTEELRYDIYENIIKGISYIGIAEQGAPTDSRAWAIMKQERDGKGDPMREQIFLDVAWDSRRTL